MNRCKRSNIMLTQKTGQSTTEIMSQKAVTDCLNGISSDLEKEISERKEADNNLQQQIDKFKDFDPEALKKETQSRINADNELSHRIAEEAKTREAEDQRIWDSTPHLEGGLIPSSYLPSYVDDVLEGTLSTFPRPGERGKIYVDTNTNLTYRWTGTQYIEISKSIGLGNTAGSAYPGDKGKELEDKLGNIEEGAQKNVPAFDAVCINENDVRTASSEIHTLSFASGEGIQLKGPFPHVPANVQSINISLKEAYVKGVAGGVAPLDENGKISQEFLPDGIIGKESPKDILIIHDIANTSNQYGISDEDAYLLKENLQAFTEKKLLLYTTYINNTVVHINYIGTSGINIYGQGYFIDHVDKRLYQMLVAIHDSVRPTISVTVTALQDFKYAPKIQIENNASMNGENPGFVISEQDSKMLGWYKDDILAGRTSLVIKDNPSGTILRPLQFSIDSDNNYRMLLINNSGKKDNPEVNVLIVILPEGETHATVKYKQLLSFS